MTTSTGVRLASVATLFLAGAAVAADGIRFSDFIPMPASAGPTADESRPITFGNPAFDQRSIADRNQQRFEMKPNSGNWDMITLNETGRRRGRYLFTVFETGQSGVQRHDLRTGEVHTIWQSPTPGGHVAFDPSYWTPWGTFITGEESWTTEGEPEHPEPYGRLFELLNPLTAPPIYDPVTPWSNEGARFLHRNVIPRTSHEGIQFDNRLNMYFIDELNGGNVYKYVPAAHPWLILAGWANYFAAGQTFVLRVGDGNTPNATGQYTWVPFTNKIGAPLPGARVITDANGVTSVDARNTTNLPQFKGTDYQRPEDMQMQTIRGRQYLYMTTTTTSETYRLDLQTNRITVFANRNTIDLATGMPVGAALASPDNLAIDHENNIYIIEDRAGGVDNDIWFARDRNKDGDLTDPGEGIGRWASNGTRGSEFTGLYFDPFNRWRAWVNIQHPTSGNDRTIEITIPRAFRDGDDEDEDEDDDRDRRGRGDDDDRDDD
jgi:secreted PhoX family phosphatase